MLFRGVCALRIGLAAVLSAAVQLAAVQTAAVAQRLQLPTRINQAPTTLSSTQIAPSTAPAATPAPAATFDPYATPRSVSPPPYSVGGISPPPGAIAPYSSPAAGAPGFVAPPSLAPGGTIAPPTQPYYAPVPGGYNAPPGALYPQGTPSIFPADAFGQVPPVTQWTRLVQEVRFSQAWLWGGDGGSDLGVNDTEISATLSFPLFGLQTPFLVTPGFGLHLWDGPISGGPGTADLPGQTYDAFLDTGWNPVVNNYFSAELGVRVGVYTDWNTFSTDSVRIMGRGLGVLRVSPTCAVKAGVVYIDRNDIKLMPAFGVIWDPSPDRHWEIFFPRPKLACRLTTLANHNLWWYVAGEYGGGAWTIIRDAGFTDSFDYNDIRALLGVEWIPETESGATGFFEVGYVFNRELIYVSLSPPSQELTDTFMLRGGFAF